MKFGHFKDEFAPKIKGKHFGHLETMTVQLKSKTYFMPLEKDITFFEFLIRALKCFWKVLWSNKLSCIREETLCCPKLYLKFKFSLNNNPICHRRRFSFFYMSRYSKIYFLFQNSQKKILKMVNFSFRTKSAKWNPVAIRRLLTLLLTNLWFTV